MKKALSLFLVLVMLCGMMPMTVFATEEAETNPYKGKVISILGDSASTFAGYIPVADGFNLAHRARYPQSNLLTDVNETWWMQVITALGAKLGVNDSWAGSQVLNTMDTNSGDLGPDVAMASLTRIQNLGSNGTPDVILFYGAGNDIGRAVPLGEFNPGAAPQTVDLTTAKWDTFADAYVAAILRLKHFYPDSAIIVMLYQYIPGYFTNAELDEYNSLIQAVCDHYNIPTIDLRNSGVTPDMLPDNIHPNAEGMDLITQTVLNELIADCTVTPGENVVYSISHELVNATASKHYYKSVSAGSEFSETITGENVTITMGGVDITADCYSDGTITISEVTDDIVITAKGDFNADGHLQQLPDTVCAGTNLWTALEPENIYYTVNGWGNVTAGTAWSITFPIQAGDQIWATSFGKSGENGDTANGVRITWFDENGVLATVDRNTVYKEFVANGHITAPEGALALNVTMASNNPNFKVYILNRDHSYENGICTACGTEHPNLANFEGKVISILGDSISTFAGYIPVADGFNLKHYARYPQDNLFTEVEHTWWMQVLTALDAKLGINESWRSTEVYNYIDAEVNSSYDGTKACMASITRIQNLGSNGTPDVILFYGGTNDITQRRPVGSFDPATAPTEVDLISVKWDTVADAYVDAIMRMQHYYPNAEIVAMLPTFTYKNTDAVIEEYNSVFAAICEHYGVTYVDLRECGISTSDLPDGTHPNATGMDYITAAVMDVLMSDCDVEAGEHIVHSVTHNLTGAESSLSYYKSISHGNSFVTTITGENLKVTVNMGGTDITADCYTDGVVSIEKVTGDIVITAKGIQKTIFDDYLQELPENLCSGTNLWTELKPINLYYTTSGWGLNASGSAYSITIPISEGDQIWATSFQKSGINGGTSNGIRLTWFSEKGVLKSLSPQVTYAEFAANGSLTAPVGAVAVNVVMWNGKESNEVYILNRDHAYENGICLGCGAAQPGPVITQQPTNSETKLGERYCVTVEAEGEGLTYQWYIRNAGSSKWYKSSVKDNTYDDVMTKARAGREVYCVITDANGNSVTTDTVKLICLPSEKLEIITQPNNGEAVLGERFCITVEAKGESLKYQWYFRNKGATRWTKSSVTDSTYDAVMTTTRDGREVYCVITDLAGNKITTDIVTLVRVPMKLEITSQPTDVSATFGETFCATVVAKGEGLRYQWYYRNAGSETWYQSGIRDNTYNAEMTKSRMGREVYCVITDRYGNSVTTDTVKLNAIPSVELKLLDQSYESAAMGERFCVTVNAQGDGLKYQWYFRNAGSSKWYKSGVKDNTYDDVMNRTRANREVYCVITDAFGNQIVTDVVTLEVDK